MDTDIESSAPRLREERLRTQMTQAEFASIGGVQKRAQIHYEQGDRAPDAQYLIALLAGGIDVPYILSGVRTDSRALANLVLAAQATESAIISDPKRESLRRKLLRSASNHPPPDAVEWELLEDFRRCVPEDRAAIRQMTRRLARSRNTDVQQLKVAESAASYSELNKDN